MAQPPTYCPAQTQATEPLWALVSLFTQTQDGRGLHVSAMVQPREGQSGRFSEDARGSDPGRQHGHGPPKTPCSSTSHNRPKVEAIRVPGDG